MTEVGSVVVVVAAVGFVLVAAVNDDAGGAVGTAQMFYKQIFAPLV